MSKKLITACLGVLALAAFALPAAASAANSPVLTHPTGTVLGKGASIDGHNTTLIVLKSGSTVLTECSSATLTGTLTKNESNTVEGNIETATFSGTGPEREGDKECTSPGLGNFSVDTNLGNGTPWCIRSTSTMAEDEFQVRGGKCTEAARSITFVLTSTTVGTCKYNRTEALKGIYTTDTPGIQDAILHFTSGTSTEFKKEEGGILCPSTGNLEGSFTLETNNPPNTEPLYFS